MLTLLTALTAFAGPSTGVDVEIDPLAYAIGGASIHGGLHVDRVRFDLGVFSLKLPDFLTGQPDFVAQGHGYGLKVDVFTANPQKKGNTGLHAGVQLDVTHQVVTHEPTGDSALYREVAGGGRIGYRIQHRSGLYIDPWLGVIYRGNTPTELALGGQTFTQSKVTPFPTLHLGWRL